MYTFATSLMIGFFFRNIDEERKVDKGNERQKWREENMREIFPSCQLRVEGRHRAKEERGKWVRVKKKIA